LYKLQAAILRIKPKVKLAASVIAHDPEEAAESVLQEWDM